MVDRIRFLQHLYEQLPDKSAVLTNKTVTSLTQSDTGVSVTCADGSSYEGDILVGADGVRSTVRSLAFGTSARSMPKGLSSTYQCIFGKGPMIPGLPANEMVELLDGRHTFQFLTANELVFWFLYLRTNQTVTEWVNYTDEELHAFAERHLDHPVSEGGKVTFGHLWRTRHQARLVNLEEGVLDNWHTGRVALLGDAVHKMTPNLALGGNNAIESVASLVNHLKRLTEDNSAPDTRSIEAAFASFQTERKDRATWCMRYSYALLRHAGAMNALLNLLSRFMTLDAGDRLVADKLIAWVSCKTGRMRGGLHQLKKLAAGVGNPVYEHVSCSN